MSQQPFQDIAAPRCDVADAGDGEFRDWAEVGGGVRLPAWNNGAVTASVTASIAPNQTTTYVSRLGVVQAFLRGRRAPCVVNFTIGPVSAC
jgi:hypothetical protein